MSYGGRVYMMLGQRGLFHHVHCCLASDAGGLRPRIAAPELKLGAVYRMSNRLLAQTAGERLRAAYRARRNGRWVNEFDNRDWFVGMAPYQ